MGYMWAPVLSPRLLMQMPMPELPEVETVRLGLVPALEGRTILKADIRRGDLRRPFPLRFAERLTGRKVLRLLAPGQISRWPISTAAAKPW